MSMEISGQIDWNNIEHYLKWTDLDVLQFAEIIVQGIIDGINIQKTPKGETLDINSPWTLKQKMLKGQGQLSLIATRKLVNPSTYIIEKTENEIIIHLSPEYKNVHLDLIEISQITGKNYEDFFGISKDTWDLIKQKANHLIADKLEILNHG